MTNPGAAILDRFVAAGELLASLPVDVAAFASLDEATLLAASQLHAAIGRSLGAVGVAIAGEIGRRSAPSLGARGLAQRAGRRTPEEFVRQTTGVSGHDAVVVVRLGELLGDLSGDSATDDTTGPPPEPRRPWLRAVAVALASRTLSIAAADAIQSGVGAPNAAISSEVLEAAVEELVALAGTTDADRLHRRARQMRDELDVSGVRLREEQRHTSRSLRFIALPNGMSRLVWLMDGETAAVVKELYDRATSPKLGGVRFLSADQNAKSRAIAADGRTAEQLASDAFEHLLVVGSDADSSSLVGSGAPVVRVAVTAQVIAARTGVGHLEGQADAVSVETVERLRCGAIVIPVVFDDSGRALDVGREQRTFTKRQRHALALRDGGCMAPGCDRPPSWTEAHHINFWARDGGNTDTADGILLCKHHHLLFHNNGWEITRDGRGRYWLTPPEERDLSRAPILLVSKSPTMRELRRR